MIGVKNFKREHGFSQGNSRMGADALKKRLDMVEANKPAQADSNTDDYDAFDIDTESLTPVNTDKNEIKKVEMTKKVESPISVSFDDIIYEIREVK